VIVTVSSFFWYNEEFPRDPEEPDVVGLACHQWEGIQEEILTVISKTVQLVLENVYLIFYSLKEVDWCQQLEGWKRHSLRE